MDALTDIFAKHGALASTTKPTRDASGRFAPKSAETAPLTVWRDVEIGDMVRVKGSNWVDDGVHEVTRLNGPSDSETIRVNDLKRGDWWVGKQHVVEIVSKTATKSEAEPLDRETINTIKVGDRVLVKGSRWTKDGEREVLDTDRYDRDSTIKILADDGGKWWVRNENIFAVIKQSKPEASVAQDTPAYLAAKVDDTVRVEGVDGLDDGVYRVMNIDEGDSMRLKVDDNDGGMWVTNHRVVAIVTDAAAAGEPAWKRAKVGDTVRVSGHYDYKTGEYVVITAEPDSYDGAYNLEVMLSDRASHTTWVRNVDVIDIVAPAAVVTKDESAFRTAKVGDTIRVSRGTDHPAGEYVVTKVSESTHHRLAVDYQGRNDRIWWVRNSVVEAVTSKRQGAVAVRGNCLIHVDVPTIMSNRSNNRHEPVIVARRLASIGTAERFRELAWDGPSRFVHHHFQRIEGTDIQNWVETDAPLTVWKPDGTIDVLNPIPGTVMGDMRAMTKPILGAFVIHIAAPVLAKNRKEGRNDPVIAVRMAHSNWATDVMFARKVEWNGPSRMVHRPSTPIPGTEGRGVSFVETDADVTVYLDHEEPIVLTMPALRAAA